FEARVKIAGPALEAAMVCGDLAGLPPGMIWTPRYKQREICDGLACAALPGFVEFTHCSYVRSDQIQGDAANIKRAVVGMKGLFGARSDVGGPLHVRRDENFFSPIEQTADGKLHVLTSFEVPLHFVAPGQLGPAPLLIHGQFVLETAGDA